MLSKEREKTASALGQKMDAQTLNQKERIQMVGAAYPLIHWFKYCAFIFVQRPMLFFPFLHLSFLAQVGHSLI